MGNIEPDPITSATQVRILPEEGKIVEIGGKACSQSKQGWQSCLQRRSKHRSHHIAQLTYFKAIALNAISLFHESHYHVYNVDLSLIISC